MKNVSTQQAILRELREIRKLLEEHFPPANPKEVDLPNVVDITWALSELGISRSTFYKHVKNKLLLPVLRIGNRDYYDRNGIRQLRRLYEENRLPYRRLWVVGQDGKRAA